ncbi:MAG: phosphoribosylformylglycinamidine synthase subunit PurL, partial [Chloroflexi bacterium]|nr:phosphoribosylformylglycinamidine synthase subunit PurL [Chloroflexota bacterium]
MENLKVIRVEVWGCHDDQPTPDNQWLQALHSSGFTSVTHCFPSQLYFINGQFSLNDIQHLSSELLADPVTEHFSISAAHESRLPVRPGHTIEVTLLPGVTDPAAENLLRAAHLLGLTGIQQVATGKRYVLPGGLDSQDVYRLANEVFSNPVIQRYAVNEPIAPPFIPVDHTNDHVQNIPLRTANAADLQRLSAERCLSLSLAEMQAVQAYFQQEGRDPIDLELEMLAQTWSEHCVHKTFKASIDYTGPLPGVKTSAKSIRQQIDGLLNTYIRGATDQLQKTWIRSAFVDNAGIIAFDEKWDIAFKLETHNHPSAIEPFGGANTGVGGVVRDILGVSARPIANTDVLCFGPHNLPEEELPAGTLHPRRVIEGVVHGVEDYGNKMGIPTVNGAVLYHPGYTSNPLVFCGCVGILPHDSNPTQSQPGDLIIVIGGRTGRDGLHGATFSSMEMDHTTSETSGTAVQIGHPINEKQVLEVILRARDERLYNAITDCGAGGLSSAVGEMAGETGARINLENVPLKYPGLRPWEIWLSEAQERMVLAVPPQNWSRLQTICAGQDVEAVCLGELEPTGRLRLFYGQTLAADLSVEFLHKGIPQRHLRAEWAFPPALPFKAESPQDLRAALLDLLAHPNISSKENIVRRYDHEVQGGTVVKPLVGVDEHGPSDAAVLVPLDVMLDQPQPDLPVKGLALGMGIAPTYTDYDPYAMAWAAVDEAMRNVTAVGADPDQVALLDNFCWGNPDLPDRLGSLVRCVQGCYDAAVAYGAPYISGKDSLNNEYTGQDGQKHTILGTLLISAVGQVADVQKTVTMDLKQAGNSLYMIGDTRAELGGSHYGMVVGAAGGVVPQPVPDALARLRALYRAIQAGLVQSCHDCSEGGLGITLAEMCLAGRLGAEITLARVPGAAAISRDDVVLFSESLSRLVVEVRPTDAPAFEQMMAAVPHAQIGTVTRREQGLVIYGRSAAPLLMIPVNELERRWRGWLPAVEALPAPKSSQSVNFVRPQHNPRVLILHANGTNRDREAVLACEMAGAKADILHINQLLTDTARILDYHMLVVPGGFSYGDNLGAGKLSALDLRYRLGDVISRFVESGRPVLGICNGFQTLVKAGILPGVSFGTNGDRSVTLA